MHENTIYKCSNKMEIILAGVVLKYPYTALMNSVGPEYYTIELFKFLYTW